MNRRKLFGFLAALPFAGAMFKPDDGVALISTSHPDRVALYPIDLSEENLVHQEIEYFRRAVYAVVGDVVTCENEHPICQFTRTVFIGEMFEPSQLSYIGTNISPELGTLEERVPGCVICGARWWRGGNRFHFADRGYAEAHITEIRGTDEHGNPRTEVFATYLEVPRLKPRGLRIKPLKGKPPLKAPIIKPPMMG